MSDLVRRLYMEYEFPSAKKLFLATLTALSVASLILFLFVLPAEYGFDPTGLGKWLRLKELGESKIAMSAKAISTLAFEVHELCNEQGIAQPGIQTDTVYVELKPGEAAELKLMMKAGDTISYEWLVNKGHLNFDTHGDSKSIKYHGYKRGKYREWDAGRLTAAFKGAHGWCWRNRSKEVVQMTLVVQGAYEKIKRVV